jgi:hypothetical protein
MRSGPVHPGAFINTESIPFEPENETEKKLSAVTSKSVENVPLPDTPIGLAKAIEAKRTSRSTEEMNLLERIAPRDQSGGKHGYYHACNER